MDKLNDIDNIFISLVRALIVDNKTPTQVQFILGTDEPIKRIVIRGAEYVYDPEMYIWVQKETTEERGKENGRI